MLQAETRERLRALIRDIESRPTIVPHPTVSAVEEPSAAPTRASLDAWRGAVRRETPSGWLTFREQDFDLDADTVGSQRLSTLRHATGEVLGLLSHEGEAADATLEELVFLDIETTGLGGAGAMVFLVAAAHVEGSTLRMRQYLAETPAEEGALLDALLGDVRAVHPDPVLVTYNGRGFDAPMLDGRATLHRRRAGFESLRHVDMLPPARQLYRGWLPSCRLADVEATVLDVTRPTADVDGAEVPAWYFRFLRSGDMRFVAPIASHNLIDVLSVAALLGRVAAFLEEAERPAAQEALGLGRLLSRRAPERAMRAYGHALVDLEEGPARLEALWRLSLLHKRHGMVEEAAHGWRELARQYGPWSLRAHEELAKFLEHRAGDAVGATAVVEEALARLDARDALDPGRWPPVAGEERWLRVFHHRLDRLRLRVARMPPRA